MAQVTTEPISAAQRRALIRADADANHDYPKSLFVLRLFRWSQYLRSRQGVGLGARLMYLAVGGVYKVVSEWVLGIELPASTVCGPGLRLRHGVGLVVNPAARIGTNVMLRHNVTLGNRRELADCPTIEDDVELGVGVVVIGRLTVGRGAQIGPNVVVVRDVPAGAVLYSPKPVSRTDRHADGT